MLTQLEHKSTNPLTLAMNADPLKTRTTFTKWFDIINGVLGQVILLETFAAGLLEERDTNDVIERSKKLLSSIQSWEDDYKVAKFETKTYHIFFPERLILLAVLKSLC